MNKVVVLIMLSVFTAVSQVQAEFFHLKNGDRISGDILENNETNYKIKTYYFGEVTLEKSLIAGIETQTERRQAGEPALEQAHAPVEAPSPKYWDSKFGVGYQVSNGNSKNSHLNVGLDSHYKKDRNEWIFKNKLEYGSDRGKMNNQKFFGKAQNNTRWPADERWFYSRILEVDHDRFADIDYRVLPSLGIGYWFFEGDDGKAEADLSLGWEYTNYASQTKSTSNAALIPHFYVDKVLIGRLKAGEDLTFYPSLSNFSNYRLRSESFITNPISDKLSWKLSFVDEYNSNPPAGAKKNDTTLMTSLEYAF